MKRRSSSIAFTIALCASLTLHALLFMLAEKQYERALWAMTFGSIVPLREATSATELSEAAPILVVTPPHPLPDLRLGRADGTGTATDESPGDEPMQARHAEQDQPLLRRDPGANGTMNEELAPPAGEVAPQVGVAALEQQDEPMPQRSPKRVLSSDGEQPAAEQSAAAAAEPIAAAASGAARAVVPPRGGTPAPQGESDSDAFSSSPGSIEFRGGKVVARLGRQHRITRPRINLAGLVDTVSLHQLALVMELRIDTTGNVVAARIVQSSGSDQIDQACRLAAYEWWFEPLKGRSTETFAFGIRFY
jgi:hypothetical protein